MSEAREAAPGEVIKAGALRDCRAGRRAQRGGTGAQPRVDFEREDGLVRRIRVTCGCGQEIVVECEYGESAEGET